MKCAIFERIPYLQRSAKVPAAAVPIDSVDIPEGLRNFEIANYLKALAEERGYKLASSPSKATGGNWDWVMYVEPPKTSTLTPASSRKRPVKIGGGATSRRIAATSRQAVSSRANLVEALTARRRARKTTAEEEGKATSTPRAKGKGEPQTIGRKERPLMKSKIARTPRTPQELNEQAKKDRVRAVAKKKQGEKDERSR